MGVLAIIAYRPFAQPHVSSRQWANIIAFGAWVILLWVIINDASTIQIIQDHLQVTPDSSLRTIQSYVSDAVQTQERYLPISLILAGIAACVAILGRFLRRAADRGNAA